MPNPNTNRMMYLTPVTEDDLYKIVMNLNNNKSIGVEDIPTKIFKECFNQLKKTLLHIINISFSTGVFPEILKTAKVTPIYKKDDKLLSENYRPISILSYLKIFCSL